MNRLSACDNVNMNDYHMIYGKNNGYGQCITYGSKQYCVGGSGGSIRGTGGNGGGDGAYIDFFTSSIVDSKPGTPGTGGGAGGYGFLGTGFDSAPFKPGGSGIVVLSYLADNTCPPELPYYNWALLSPVCTTCLATDYRTPLFDSGTGLCGSCPASNPYYDPSTKTCVTTCPTPLTPNPSFGNICAVPPLTCQGARPYFNGYECTGTQVNFSTQGGATGGDSVINNGAYVVHTFTTNGTFTPPVNLNLVGDVLIVGGGGGGGTYSIEDFVNPRSAGGGGGGDVVYLQNISFGQQSWTVTVGQGGNPNQNGGDSSFGTNIAKGGGAGSAYPDIVDASSGASGGGGSGRGNIGYALTGTSGFSGGNGIFVPSGGSAGGGGGGKYASGSYGTMSQGGNGGDGISNSITGTVKYYGGGGGGSAVTLGSVGSGNVVRAGLGGQGGRGGGGYGAGSVVYNYLNYQKTNMTRGDNGVPGTGGGGGGGASTASPGPANYAGNPVTNPGSFGGSGIVIVRYSTAGLCPSNLPYFNPGLKTCTSCPDATPLFNAATNACTRCPGVTPFWNGIACVAACPSVLPRADTNNVCQLPCAPASPNWDGNQCTKVCPETKPISSGGICTNCPAATPYWEPITKLCVSSCPESVNVSTSVCTSCYDLNNAQPYWNGSVCAPCPDATPAWTGPVSGCQPCPLSNPIWDPVSQQCKTCYAINPLKPFYNQTSGGYAKTSVYRCQPCPVSSVPYWDNVLKTCKTCIDAFSISRPFWDMVTSNCTACPVSRPYWNSRVCALPTNIITTPLISVTTANVTAAASTSASPPWRAFDGDTTTFWQSNSTYIANSIYTGKYSTQGINGEVLQIQFPYSYILSSYTLSSPNLLRWAVLGSTDGFVWKTVDDRTSADTTLNQTFYITPPISNAFPVYRLVATKSSATSVSVNEWNLQTANDPVSDQTAQEKSAFTVVSGAVQGCDSVSCVLSKSSNVDITDLIYGNYPPTQIGSDLLPEKTQQAISNCSSNIDCGFVQFDFMSNASNFSTSAPYTVSTLMTVGADVGVFQKKYGTVNPPKLRAPPGFKYDYNYIRGTRLGSNLTATIDVCGTACMNNPACVGFNYYYTSSNCEFYSTMNPIDYHNSDRTTYEPSYEKSSFVRDPYIITGQRNTNRTPYTNLNDSGSMCQNMTACNTDIISLVSQLGTTIKAFSTAELDSCNYCPIRGVTQQGSVYTITNEANIVSNVMTTSAVQAGLVFSNSVTVNHIQINSGNYRIRPYSAPENTANINIRTTPYYASDGSTNNFGGYSQIWVGSEPFAAGIVPKNCFNSQMGGTSGDGKDCYVQVARQGTPLFTMGGTLKDAATGEVCLTTEKGTYIYQTCSGSCSTGTDLDPGTYDVYSGKNQRGGGITDLLYWEIIPVDWVENGFYIRSKGSDYRIQTEGVCGLKPVATSGQWGWKPAGMKARPYLKWGAYIGSTTDVGYTGDQQMSRAAQAFGEGFVTGTTLGFASVNLVESHTPNDYYFTSFPPQFQTAIAYPHHQVYQNLQQLPSQGPAGSKFDDADYIFVIEPV